ncbi:Short-chain dehydrogenase/reductase family 42E member 1 [Tetrabaena socialis]|uniref:Short-chain dehydrogenase/reductase family 42E member 1 n=1 Tax=Tetrabaena socialis TaxID=47790 RepID=A0A2J7ZTY7_9CHLO|nr:Short-chain dehydrogenase/reductase family 42E member 1 [Tetrabaena socialis]|eukprot:PNH03700.1 Short-chain dehydrogenase/reductase family 42E member 1 [Tetrabaena socialis]
MVGEGARRRVAITGGCGFLGLRLANTILEDEHGGVEEAVLLDLAPPTRGLPRNCRFLAVSVADAAGVDAAFTAAGRLDAVFHVASYGMSGRELRGGGERIRAVNVGGTANVLAACLRHAVPRLVYVSTVNVIFVGRPIHGGDESAPYPPPSAYKDHYSASKAEAERMVLAANGTPLGGGGSGSGSVDGAAAPATTAAASGSSEGAARNSSHAAAAGNGGAGGCSGSGGGGGGGGGGGDGLLYTCAVRSTGIWGAGETRHQPRVIRMVRAGLFAATFGDSAGLSDW